MENMHTDVEVSRVESKEITVSIYNVIKFSSEMSKVLPPIGTSKVKIHCVPFKQTFFDGRNKIK